MAETKETTQNRQLGKWMIQPFPTISNGFVLTMNAAIDTVQIDRDGPTLMQLRNLKINKLL
jgi:hypothetical protein